MTITFAAPDINKKRVKLGRKKNGLTLHLVAALFFWLAPLTRPLPPWFDIFCRVLAAANAAVLLRETDEVAREEQLLIAEIEGSRRLLQKSIGVLAYQHEQAIMAPIMPPPPELPPEPQYQLAERSHQRPAEVEQGQEVSRGADQSGLLVSSLASYGIEVSCEDRIEGACFNRYLLKKQAARIKVSQIAKLTEELQLDLGLRSQPIVSIQDGFIAVDIPRRDRKIFKYQQFIQDVPAQGLWLPIGVALGGDLIEVDMTNPDTCHIMGGGTTGSGKSVWLQVAVKSLCDRYQPDQLQLVLNDYGQATFGCFEGDEHLLSPVLYSPEDIGQMLEVMAGEMNRRKRLLKENGVSHLQGLNQKLETPLPRICIFTDEYSAMIEGSNEEERSQIESAMIQLAMEARKTGIHMITFMQRPDAKYLLPQIRSNHPAAVCLKVKRPEDSKIILAEEKAGGDSLLGHGDLLFSWGGKLERLQGLFWEPNSNQQVSDRVYSFPPKSAQPVEESSPFAYRYPATWEEDSRYAKNLTRGLCCYPGCNNQATETHHARYQNENGRSICGSPTPGLDTFPLCDEHHSDRSNPASAHHPSNWIKGTCQHPLEIDSRNTPEYHALLRQGWAEKEINLSNFRAA